MAYIYKAIDSYSIHYLSYKESQYDATIRLYDKHSTCLGYLAFIKNKEPIGNNMYYPETDYIILKYRINQFKDIFSILLHDNPLWLQIDDVYYNGSISSGKEPIGELEPPKEI